MKGVIVQCIGGMRSFARRIIGGIRRPNVEGGVDACLRCIFVGTGFLARMFKVRLVFICFPGRIGHEVGEVDCVLKEDFF